jgi:hypothetical protein
MFYPLLLVILLGAVWSLYWLFVFNQAKDIVAQARADLATQGATLACAQESWGGYPFRIEFACAGAEATVKTPARTMNFKAKDVAAVMMAYNFRHVLAFVDGPSELNGVGVSHNPARISLETAPDGAFDIAGEAPNVVVASAAGPLEAEMLRLFARRKDGSLDLAANADRLTVAGTALDRAEFTGATPAAILDAPDPVAAAAKTGQPFTLAEAKVTKGDVAITAKGAIHLDPEKRPAGKITTGTNDIDKLLAELAPKLQLSDENVAAAKSMLAILATDPNSKTRSADLIAQNGELYWGPFKLTDLPPLP